jgi:transposase
MTELTVTTERVDDTPLLMAHQARMGIPRLLEESFDVHGNWQGLSFGWVAAGWLSHILSEADHRMNHVQPWAARRIRALSACTGQRVRDLDFSDDRLSIILRTLSDDAEWADFESRLNRNLLRVYALKGRTVRIDTTTCSGYWEVSSDGLFQLGYSKDKRPDLPQVKVVLSTLDPLGMPIATDVVSGNRADDPLYIPAIQRVRDSLGKKGLLYIGDSKMGAVETRAFAQGGGDYYLCPLSKTQLPEKTLETYLEPVWCEEQTLTDVYREKVGGEQVQLAEGYEREVEQTVPIRGETVTWTERHLVIRSLRQARAAETRLRKRLKKALAALRALNERGRGKKRHDSVAELRQDAESLMEQNRVQGLLQVDYQVISHEREVRKYGDRPARTVVDQEFRLTVGIDEAAVEKRLRRKGWRVYATNASAEHLTLTQAVLAYRSQYLVERGCGRLKGRPLSVTPMYLERDDHATGLVRLLSLALRMLTSLEFLVRRRLAQEGAELAGLYAGNPTRSTARPTAERILEAFEHITLTVIRDPPRTLHHITPLSSLQQRILELLDFSPDIYTQLSAESSELTLK